MIREALLELKDVYQRARTPQTMDIDENPAVVHVYNPASGVVEKFDVSPSARDHSATTIASLAAAFARYTATTDPSVWVSLTTVDVVLNDDPSDHRHHRIQLPVQPSPLFDAVCKLPREQKLLLNAIRHDLKPSEIAPETFELAIANLKWETVDTENGAFGTVKSTMGRQVNSEVKGEKDIPPEISVTFEAFPAIADECPATVTIECSVVIDPAERTILVRPYPGQVDKAKAFAVEALRKCIAKAIGSDGSDVFAGSP